MRVVCIVLYNLKKYIISSPNFKTTMQTALETFLSDPSANKDENGRRTRSKSLRSQPAAVAVNKTMAQPAVAGNKTKAQPAPVAVNKTMESFFTPKPLVVANGEAEMRPVARYGRIYKRKAPNYSKKEHGKIACPAGTSPQL